MGPPRSASLFVKSIMVFEEIDQAADTALPFFADGYPGLVFQDTKTGLFMMPLNKILPAFFLYGQTIQPIELKIKGTFSLIVFQLYPFVLRQFFALTPTDLTDSCYDLSNSEAGSNTEDRLRKVANIPDRIKIISDYLLRIFSARRQGLDDSIREAIHLILENNAQISIAQLCNQVHVTKRTFERRFLNEVGISPKQFSQIIRFRQSLDQLAIKDYAKLSDIVYRNGYADQSHFIRVFKSYTGTTPRSFLSR